MPRAPWLPLKPGHPQLLSCHPHPRQTDPRGAQIRECLPRLRKPPQRDQGTPGPKRRDPRRKRSLIKNLCRPRSQHRHRSRNQCRVRDPMHLPLRHRRGRIHLEGNRDRPQHRHGQATKGRYHRNKDLPKQRSAIHCPYRTEKSGIPRPRHYSHKALAAVDNHLQPRSETSGIGHHRQPLRLR